MTQADAELAVSPPYRQQSFRIKAAQPRDIPAIVNVLLISFYAPDQTAQWLYWLMRIGIQEDLRSRLKTPANQYACLISTTVSPTSAQAGSVIGTAEISQRTCETWQLFPPRRAYVANLAISPKQRRQGAACQLLLACENVALDWGFHDIYLHVMADNQAALDLYARAGYRPCEVSNPILSTLGIRPQRLLLAKRIR